MSNVEHAMRHMRRANELLNFGGSHHQSFGGPKRARSRQPRAPTTTPGPPQVPAAPTAIERFFDYLRQIPENLPNLPNRETIMKTVLLGALTGSLLIGAMYQMGPDQALVKAEVQNRESSASPITMYRVKKVPENVEFEGIEVEDRQIMVIGINGKAVKALYRVCEDMHKHKYPFQPIYTRWPLKGPHGHCGDAIVVEIPIDDLDEMEKLPGETQLTRSIYLEEDLIGGTLEQDKLMPFEDAQAKSGEPIWEGTQNMRDQTPEEIEEKMREFEKKYPDLTNEK